jgi:hypothetical protein
MSNNPPTPDDRRQGDQRLDETLADFTDQILNETEQRDIMEDDAELSDLKETIRQLHGAVQAAQPDAKTARRIRQHVQAEWNKPAPSRNLFTWRYTPALAGGLAILVLLAVGLLFPPAPNALPATADGNIQWAFPLLVSGIIVLAILLWISRHKS